MSLDNIPAILTFLRSAEALKHTLRSAWTSTGRQESAAEHSWRLCLMALILEDFFPNVDVTRLIKLCIVHDLGEAINGDIPAPQQQTADAKAGRERTDLLQLLAPLPPSQHDELLALWDEYEAATTPEAKLAKALDKLETILQHNQGDNPADFDYGFNLGYGRAHTVDDPIIAQIRAVLDDETALRVAEN